MAVQIPRALEPTIADALRAFRVVVVTGPRRAGTTTVVRRTIGDDRTLARLDDESVLQAARADPTGFAGFGRIPRAFDEVQRGGDPLIRAIKGVVDDDPTPGQFLMNGSADFLTVPTLSESLAGRAALLDLWPLSQSEIERTGGQFLRMILESTDALLELGPSGVAPRDYLERICREGVNGHLDVSAGSQPLVLQLRENRHRARHHRTDRSRMSAAAPACPLAHRSPDRERTRRLPYPIRRPLHRQDRRRAARSRHRRRPGRRGASSSESGVPRRGPTDLAVPGSPGDTMAGSAPWAWAGLVALTR